MTQTPPPPNDPSQIQVPGIKVDLHFIPVPVNTQVERLDLGGTEKILILFRGPNSAMSTFWDLEEAKEFANLILSKASGLTIPAKDALGNLPLDRMLRDGNHN